MAFPQFHTVLLMGFYIVILVLTCTFGVGVSALRGVENFSLASGSSARFLVSVLHIACVVLGEFLYLVNIAFTLFQSIFALDHCTESLVFAVLLCFEVVLSVNQHQKKYKDLLCSNFSFLCYEFYSSIALSLTICVSDKPNTVRSAVSVAYSRFLLSLWGIVYLCLNRRFLPNTLFFIIVFISLSVGERFMVLGFVFPHLSSGFTSTQTGGYKHATILLVTGLG